MTAAATTGGEVQPSDGASMTAYTNAINPAADSAAPAQSRRPASALRDSGMTRRPTTIAATQSGTLTRKIEPHEKLSIRNPPATGPRATPSPAVAAQMPTAVARSRSSGNTLMSSDSVAGMMKAAPAPIAARQAMRASTFAAVAAPAELAANIARPARSVRGARTGLRAHRRAVAALRRRAAPT